MAKELKKFEVKMFILGLPATKGNFRTEIFEAKSQDEAEQMAHDKYVTDGWGVYSSRELTKEENDAEDAYRNMKLRSKAIRGIIDALTFYTNKMNAGGSYITIKPFPIEEDIVVESRKEHGSIVSIKADIFSEEQDDKYAFDGENERFECFIVWVEFEDCVERLCNLDTYDINRIYEYMFKKCREKFAK
jgi:hypothetical protein